MPRKLPVLFVAGTGQHSGKTLVAMGLTMHAHRSGLNVRYMKPVGQRTVTLHDEVVDEDVALILQICNLPVRPRVAGPVTIPQGFTRDFLAGQADSAPLRQRILEAFEELSQGAELVIVEGTGHAGVGSVLELSNATVAHLLGAEVILITGGGIGRPIDEFCLNQALFAREGVRIFGVICNKVLPDKIEEIRGPVRKWMDTHGVKLLGMIPFEPMLTEITVGQIVQEIGANVICGHEHLGCRIRRVVVGAEPPHRFLYHFGPGVMALIPGDRDDLVLAAVSAQQAHIPGSTAAICLTSGILPHENIMSIVHRANMPVITVQDGMYKAASRISDLVAKITSSEEEKVQRAYELVTQYVDLQALAEHLSWSGASW
jgi:BioD-like phosphotransacetylase family protein